jgi:hypothetical protein
MLQSSRYSYKLHLSRARFWRETVEMDFINTLTEKILRWNMETADWIQFGILLTALLTLITQIVIQNRETRKIDKRNLIKLTIFNYCIDTPRTEQEIILNSIYDTNRDRDIVEVRKSIYEMLKDGTLRLRSNNTYKARRNTAKEEKEDNVEKNSQDDKSKK